MVPPTQPDTSNYVTPQQPSSYGNLNLPTPNSTYPSGGTHAPPTTPQDMPRSPQQPTQPAQKDSWAPPPNPGMYK